MAIRMKRGTAASFEDLITIVNAWATDAAIHGADAFQLMRSDTWPRGAILKARGQKEGEVIYLGLMANRIEKGKTYVKWFMQENNLATYFVWHKNGLDKIAPVDRAASTVNKATFIETPDLEPSPMLIVSVETAGVFQHLALGALEKIGDWDGGLIFSGSRNSYHMFTSSATFEATAIEA